MISKNRVRVSITPTKDIIKEVDAIADVMGTSRSMVCSMLIAQGIESYKQIKAIPPEKLSAIAELLVK